MQLTSLPIETLEPHPDQPRTALKELDELAASIAKVGVLYPPTVVRVEPMTDLHYRIIDGHRRVEAAKQAGLTMLVCLVAETETPAQQMAAVMATFTTRVDLTSVEKARGIQTMLDLGVKPADVTKITGLKKQALQHARAVAKSAEKLDEDLAGKQVSLEEAAAIAEFADDPKAYGQLLKQAGMPYFKHELQQAKEARENARKRAAAVEELTAAGVRVIQCEHGYYEGPGIRLENFRGYGAKKEPTPEEHASCPGHGAFVRRDGTIDYYCEDLKQHPEVNKGGGGARPKTEAEKAAQRLKLQVRAELKAAAVVRREFLKSVCSGKAPDAKPVLEWILAEVTAHGLPEVTKPPYSEQNYHRDLRELFESLVDGRSNNVQKLLAIAFAQIEGMIDATTSQDPTRVYESTGRRYGQYFDLLTSLGYATAPCERVLCGQEKPKLAEKKAPAKKRANKAAATAQEPAGDAEPAAEGSEDAEEGPVLGENYSEDVDDENVPEDIPESD